MDKSGNVEVTGQQQPNGTNPQSGTSRELVSYESNIGMKDRTHRNEGGRYFPQAMLRLGEPGRLPPCVRSRLNSTPVEREGSGSTTEDIASDEISRPNGGGMEETLGRELGRVRRPITGCRIVREMLLGVRLSLCASVSAVTVCVALTALTTATYTEFRIMKEWNSHELRRRESMGQGLVYHHIGRSPGNSCEEWLNAECSESAWYAIQSYGCDLVCDGVVLSLDPQGNVVPTRTGSYALVDLPPYDGGRRLADSYDMETNFVQFVSSSSAIYAKIEPYLIWLEYVNDSGQWKAFAGAKRWRRVKATSEFDLSTASGFPIKYCVDQDPPASYLWEIQTYGQSNGVPIWWVSSGWNGGTDPAAGFYATPACEFGLWSIANASVQGWKCKGRTGTMYYTHFHMTGTMNQPGDCPNPL